MGYGGAGDARADNDDVGGWGKGRRGAMVCERGERILPVGRGGMDGWEDDGWGSRICHEWVC